ncbi:MAG TPA: toll/interleukin-1 receptor domain-containing protein [Cyclobacteriaceae bacterium]|nr:toll/interleukin-1 receptor domain-containing protein [Cyclobacteriaceae bacterium]
MWFTGKDFDYEVFLSHAVEDKEAIANELCERLISKGIKVWYSGNELRGGEWISETIYKGLHASRFGVIVMSQHFHASEWTRKELNWLEAREKKEKSNIILTVLHDMTHEEFAVIHPELAAKFYVESKRGADYVVEKIFKEVHNYRAEKKKKKLKVIQACLLISFILIASISYSTFRIYTNRPTPYQIESAINNRITNFLNTIDNRYINPLKSESSRPTSESEIDSVVSYYRNFKSYYRNEYEFNNGLRSITGRKNVEDAISTNLIELSDQPGYGMDSVDIYFANVLSRDGLRHSRFSLLNKRNVGYTSEEKKDGPVFSVKVNYVNPIRYIDVVLTLPGTANGTKRHEMTLLGFLPAETYYFEEGSDGEWYFKSVE